MIFLFRNLKLSLKTIHDAHICKISLGIVVIGWHKMDFMLSKSYTILIHTFHTLPTVALLEIHIELSVFPVKNRDDTFYPSSIQSMDFLPFPFKLMISLSLRSKMLILLTDLFSKDNLLIFPFM